MVKEDTVNKQKIAMIVDCIMLYLSMNCGYSFFFGLVLSCDDDG